MLCWGRGAPYQEIDYGILGMFLGLSCTIQRYNLFSHIHTCCNMNDGHQGARVVVTYVDYMLRQNACNPVIRSAVLRHYHREAPSIQTRICSAMTACHWYSFHSLVNQATGGILNERLHLLHHFSGNICCMHVSFQQF